MASATGLAWRSGSCNRFAVVAENVPTYRAEQAPDGTFTVFDVPVFGEIEKYAHCGNPEIDGEWLSGALARFAAREAEGYLPPLHIKHHGYGDATQPAGHFRLTRVGSLSYEGQQIQVLFADFTAVPEHVFARMQAGELPYRSVEVLDWDETEIHSVALLDDEVPFFRFPNLRIGDVALSADLGSLRAYALHDKRPSYLFRLAGGFTVSTKKQTGAKPKAAFAEGEKPEDKPEGEMSEGGGEGGADIDAIVSRVLESVMAAVEQKIAEAISKAAGSGGQMAAGTQATDHSAQLAEMTGRIAALEHWKTEAAEKAAVEARFTAARSKLKAFRLSQQDEQDLHRAAARGDEETDRLVGVFERSLTADPPATFAAAVARATRSGGDEPAEVAKFAAGGTDAHAAARKHWRTWEQLKRAAPDFATPLQKYLEIQMSQEQAQ